MGCPGSYPGEDIVWTLQGCRVNFGSGSRNNRSGSKHYRYPSLMACLNCTKETKLATIFYIRPSKSRKPLNKSVPVTIEQIDSIPEISKALEIYNDESLKKEKRVDAMRFISERVQNFLYLAIYPESNSVLLAEKFLGLPGFREMDEIIDRQLSLELPKGNNQNDKEIKILQEVR